MKLDAALALLTPREEEILRLYYGIGGRAYTQTEIGRRLAVTDGRVGQLRQRALGKLAAKLDVTPMMLLRWGAVDVE